MKVECTAVIFLCIGLAMQVCLTGTIMAGNTESYGSISPVSDMLHPRFNHTATVLSDGRVMACGGSSDGMTSMASAEVFDTLTNQWSAVDDMALPRMRHTATLLPSGEVLVAGGYIGRGHPSLIRHFSGAGNISLSSCELFNASSGTFTKASPLYQGRFWQSAVSLLDGRVLVIGGLNVSGGALASCEIYIPWTDRWLQAANMSEPRARFAAGLLPDGRVIVAGGHGGKEKVPFDSAEIYDPVTDLWTDAPPMKDARGYPGYAVVEGKFIVSGGFSSPSTPDWNSTEVYDPYIGEWRTGPDMGYTRHSHIILPLGNGEALAIGGSDCFSGACHSSLEVLDPSQTAWRDPYLTIQGRLWSQGCLLPDGNVLILGGRSCLEASGRTEVFSLPSKGPDKDRGPSFSILMFIAIIALFMVMPMVIIVCSIRKRR